MAILETRQPYMAAMLRLYRRGLRPLPDPPDNTPELPDSCWNLDPWYDRERRRFSPSGPGAATSGPTPLQGRRER